MTIEEMPAAEVEIDTDLVMSLLAAQRPDLTGQTVTPLSFGWDNVSFRIGEDRVARLPRRAMAVPLIRHEALWLPVLGPALPLPVPVPEFVGEPGPGYPWPWLICPYLEGHSAGMADDLDEPVCSIQMGEFLAALHRAAPADAPRNPFRGGPLSDRADSVMARIPILDDPSTRARLETMWVASLEADLYGEAPVWLHGDLHPQNLLTKDGRLTGVVDFGDITSGDPATDLSVVWSLAPHERTLFWESYGRGDDALRLRTRGWAISLSLAYLAHSADNAAMRRIGSAAIAALLQSE